MNNVTVRRGEIWLVVENRGAVGSEQKKTRPALVVSNDKCNEHSPAIEVVYMTTQPKTQLPTHVRLKKTSESRTIGSTVLCEAIHTISKQRLVTNGYIEYASDEDMDNIDEALMIGLDLDCYLYEEETVSVREETEVDTKVEEAEKRARKAEMRAQEAEKRALEAEKKATEHVGPTVAELQQAQMQADFYKKQYEALMDRIMTKAKI